TDRDAELLLDRRAHVEARVVVGAEEVRPPEVRQLLGELPGGLRQDRVVAPTVGPEPIAVVVGLELAQEIEGFRRPHQGRPACGTSRWAMRSTPPRAAPRVHAAR